MKPMYLSLVLLTLCLVSCRVKAQLGQEMYDEIWEDLEEEEFERKLTEELCGHDRDLQISTEFYGEAEDYGSLDYESDREESTISPYQRPCDVSEDIEDVENGESTLEEDFEEYVFPGSEEIPQGPLDVFFPGDLSFRKKRNITPVSFLYPGLQRAVVSKNTEASMNSVPHMQAGVFKMPESL